MLSCIGLIVVAILGKVRREATFSSVLRGEGGTGIVESPSEGKVGIGGQDIVVRGVTSVEVSENGDFELATT